EPADRDARAVAGARRRAQCAHHPALQHGRRPTAGRRRVEHVRLRRRRPLSRMRESMLAGAGKETPETFRRPFTGRAGRAMAAVLLAAPLAGCYRYGPVTSTVVPAGPARPGGGE